MRNIFADKASLIARRMLAEPGRKWVLRDFVGSDGLSLGMAQGVLAAMQERGFLERVKRGAASYARLLDASYLISEWAKWYRFSANTIKSYYSPRTDFIQQLKQALPAGRYALTLHSGANLITGFVNTDEVHVYLRLDDWAGELPALRERLGLKRLVRGGNVHFVRPFYKSSVFGAAAPVKGVPVVSALQLYLDLYNFQPRGRDHAEYLRETLERKGGVLA